MRQNGIGLCEILITVWELLPEPLNNSYTPTIFKIFPQYPFTLINKY